MKILRWLLGSVAALVLGVLFLDTFGGYLMDGPLGPIPGGAFESGLATDAQPDWSTVEKVIELEIRPSKPWSLSVWAAVVDGELYVPSAKGATRRWPGVALEDPRVRVRTQGYIYERTIVRMTDPQLGTRVKEVLAARYDLDRSDSSSSDGLWLFHIAPRS
jgi:hypothetical protein